MHSPLRLKDLATAKGALRLQRAVGSSDSQAAESMLFARRFLSTNPELANLEIGRSQGAFFDHDKPRVGVSGPEPEILAHEVGHAADLGVQQSLYKNIITPGSKKLNAILDRIALPAATVLASQASKETATKYLNYASALAAVTATPTLLNEARASHIAASKSNNYISTLAKLSPGLLEHTINSLSPVAKLQAIKYIKDLPPEQRALAVSTVVTASQGALV